MKPIKVLIVDDSALVRKILSKILNSDRGIKVVGTAHDPYIARDKIKQLKPDVITLDVEMPKMDGVTFLRNLMRLHPLPVVMISSLTEQGAGITFEALELGAVDFVAKPKNDINGVLQEYSDEIIEKVKTAAKVNVFLTSSLSEKLIEKKFSADSVKKKQASRRYIKTTDKIIALGASTGGTEAIKKVLLGLPADSPGMVISQHIPQAFSAPFASRMNDFSAMTVCEAKEGQHILPGHVYIAPGNHHLLVERNGAAYICRLNDGERVNRHKPSVDVMFRSVAQNVGPNAIGVILTGMGNDGAKGLLEMKQTGAKTMVQDKKTSVVWGMPGAAAKLGAADNAYPLARIATHILKLIG
ncbi:chemotaxis response regulator protein-glutamate methylesterase [Beggiatoa alba]|nr:chemotaxis response regulator protein-glutamate methylesterase [Beggiatoa alba]